LSVPASLAGLLSGFACCFTAPTFATFTALVVGLIGQTSRRTVCGLWIAAGLSALLHHSRAHRFFSHARWSPDQIGLVLAGLIVARFLPAGAAVDVVVDDSLFRRYGRRVHAAAWQHDGSAQGPRKIGFGNNWVIVGIVVTVPIVSRPLCLPVLFRLWRPKSATSKVDYAVELVTLLARALGRAVHVTGDGAYHGSACKTLPPTVTWTCRLQRNAVLYDLAPPPTGRRGRPALKGPRLGTPADLAATATWHTATVTRYGAATTVSIATVACLWYGAFGPQPVRVILVREPAITTDYSIALVTTDLATSPPAVLERYAARWSTEVTNLEAKHVLGVGQARNRVQRAVERTVPFGLITLSIVTIWYLQHGHHPADITQRRLESPWYTTKTEPSFEDMIIKLRRVIIAARFSPICASRPQPEEINAVRQAWAAAAA